MNTRTITVRRSADGKPLTVTLPESLDTEARTYKGLRIDDLKTAFDAAKDPDDWKAPLSVVVSTAGAELCATAIEFYTATDVAIEDLGDGYVCLSSVGYRRGPAGP